MKRALITTTINAPENLRDWGKMLTSTDVVVVAGDTRTPHDEVRHILGELDCVTRYLPPSLDTDWETDEVVGLNTIQRRNVALLEALKWAPDYVITVDDDNFPNSQEWIRDVDSIFMGTAPAPLFIQNESGWWDPGQLCIPRTVHRGYPQSRRLINDEPYRGFERDTAPQHIGVFASLWYGAADVDAIQRMTIGDEVIGIATSARYGVGTWAPFNSQATAYRVEVAPLMLMWPGVGRYDDIWASYLARTVMDIHGWHVRYGEPTVVQERNPHDLYRDLEAEMFGMKHNETVIKILREARWTLHDGLSIIDCMRFVFIEVMKNFTSLPDQTVKAFRAWDHDITNLRTNHIKFESTELPK